MSYVNPSCNLFVRDFSPGYLDTPEPDVLAPGATPDAKNAMFAKVGAEPLRVTVGKRLGHRLITPSAPTGLAADGLFDYQRIGGAATLLLVSNAQLWQYKAGAFVLVTALAGFTAGKPTRGLNLKNQAVLMDGTGMVRVASSGTVDVVTFPVGFLPPTGAPGLSVGGAPGVTGTYEGFAVWYNQTMDHESSPGPTSAAVVFANQQRVWSKPAGTPASSVTHWRVYVRRADINEVNYFRTGTFPIASATGTEATSDQARVNIGPMPHANDPPPGPFELMNVFRGYAIGVLKNDTHLYFSSQSDFESWNPADVLNVNFGRQEIRSVRVIGENCLIQTPTMSFRLEGDRMPFRIVNLHTAFGMVSPDAGTEVEGWQYGWDDIKGPYRVSRDFGTWQPLVNNRIERVLKQVNREVLELISCVHDQVRHLVLWAFAVGTSPRKRMVLGYDYTLDAWTGPLTGLEYGAWTAHMLEGTANLGIYVGDLWGRVFELFSGMRDGIPSGAFTVQGVVTSAAANSVTVAGAAFYTEGDGMMGLSVAVLSPARVWQWRRIQSNTATTILLDTTHDNPWTTVPQPGWTVIVGGIEWYWTTPWLDFGRPDRFKRGSYLTIMATTPGELVPVEIYGRFNNEPGISGSLTYQYPSGGAGLWGRGVWGTSLWASVPQQARKLRVGRAFLTAQFRFQNFYPDQTVSVTGYGLEGDWLPRRRAV